MKPSRRWAMPAFLAAALLVTLAPMASAQVQETSLVTPVATFPEAFSNVGGLLERPDGQVLVADGLGQALMLLDLAAGRADTIGRTGAGPEEYRQPDGIFALPGDSILLVDLGNGRLTAIGPDFGFGETWPIAQGSMGMRGGSMTMRLPRATDAEGRVYFQGRAAMRPGSPLPDSAYMVRWDRATEAVDTLGLVKEQERTMRSSGGPNNQNISISPVPMSPQDGWAAAGDGRLGVVRSAGYYVEWIQNDGRVVRGPENEYRSSRVRHADKVAYMNRMQRNALGMEVTNVNGSMTTSFRRGIRGGSDEPEVDGLDWPNALPAFQAGGVFVATNGDLWVERYASAGTAPVYDVFDENAVLVRRLTLPEGRTVVGFGNGSVYLARIDEFDLQWLEKYSLRSEN
jgi:hypothetical protein